MCKEAAAGDQLKELERELESQAEKKGSDKANIGNKQEIHK